MLEAKPKLHLSLFGDFRASLRDVDVTPTRNSAIGVLLLLALGDSARETRPRICELFWPDVDPKRALENLRQALFYLRRHCDEIKFEGLTISRHYVELDRSCVSVDSNQLLAEIVDQGHVPQKLLQSPEFVNNYLASIVENSDSFGDWLAERRSDFHRKLRSALQKLLEQFEPSDEQRRQCAELLLSLDPGDEVACRVLMSLSVARGEKTEALRRYTALWNYMAEEFDVEPSEQTQLLAVSIKIRNMVPESVQTEGARASITDGLLAREAAAAVIPPPVANLRRSSLLVQRDATNLGLAPKAFSDDKLWVEIGSHVEAILLPEHHGKLVNRDNEQIVLSFDHTRVAVEAALALQEFASMRYVIQTEASNIVAPPLRIAVNVEGEVVYSDHVAAPTAAAELIEFADRGEIVTCVEVKDQITHTLDANVEDLGDHTVAHLDEPVRAYRLHAPDPNKTLTPSPLSQQKTRSLLPTIAVIPPTTYSVGSDGMIGEVLADEMIAVLSVAREVNIVSRLSSRVFKNREFTAGEIGARLQANYVVSGRYREIGSRLFLNLEVIDVCTEQVVWNEQKIGTLAEFLSPDHELIRPLAANVIAAVMNFELQLALDSPMPTLESYTLLISAITLMNQLSLHAFDRAKEMLEYLIERVPHHAEPYAWLGKWHVLRVAQGWTDQTDSQGRLALDATDRALDLNPNSSLAHTIRGLSYTTLFRDLKAAEKSYEIALQANPNQSMAWLMKGCLHAFRGEGAPAMEHAQHAIHLTPLDPLRYLYDSLAGTAALAAHRFDDAHEFAKRSLMVNRTHTSTLRLLAIAQWNLGMHDDAKRTGRDLLRLEPSLTVSSWLARTPSAGYDVGDEWALALRQIGLPE